jgi:hypothetical protein
MRRAVFAASAADGLAGSEFSGVNFSLDIIGFFLYSYLTPILTQPPMGTEAMSHDQDLAPLTFRRASSARPRDSLFGRTFPCSLAQNSLFRSAREFAAAFCNG